MNHHIIIELICLLALLSVFLALPIRFFFITESYSAQIEGFALLHLRIGYCTTGIAYWPRETRLVPKWLQRILPVLSLTLFSHTGCAGQWDVFAFYLFGLKVGYRTSGESSAHKHGCIIRKPWTYGLCIAALATLGLMAGCANLTPGQQATITLTENTLATAAQIAAPLVANKTLSNYLYGAAAVATAYGSQPVPTTILQTTLPIPGLAGTVLPLVTGKSNGPKTTAIINGAAAILAGISAPVVSGT
jgi:hypothetical protein